MEFHSKGHAGMIIWTFYGLRYAPFGRDISFVPAILRASLIEIMQKRKAFAKIHKSLYCRRFLAVFLM